MILLCKLPVRLKFEWKYTYTWKFLKFTMLRDQYVKVYFPNWSSYELTTFSLNILLSAKQNALKLIEIPSKEH